jgi:hypothetical protein
VKNDLRDKAEKMLANIGKHNPEPGDESMQLLFQELQVHQIELEMQNESFSSLNSRVFITLHH